MKRRLITLAGLAMICVAASSGVSHAATITGGSATLTVNEGFAQSLGWLDANFSEGKTRAQTLSNAAPGDAYYNRISGTSGTLGTSTTAGVNGTPGTVEVIDPIRPFGVLPLNDAGGTTPGAPGASRTRQANTLNFDPNNVLGTWSTSSDFGPFVGNQSSEQIAFTTMQRYGGPFTGVLVYGDFGLRYTGTKLTLASNIDFLNAAFADIGSPNIFITGGNTLHITGNLLVGGGLNALDPSAVPGTPFGTFSMTATFAPAVPEPSSIALAATAGVGLIGIGWRRRLSRTVNNN